MIPRQQRLLVLGASGLLGTAVAKAAARSESWELHLASFTRGVPCDTQSRVHRVDLRVSEAVREMLKSLRPEMVINCAGIVKSKCSNDFDAAMLDAAVPHLLAACLDEYGGRLLHISTDCVFSGRRGDYAESACPDPTDFYGRLKLAGELYHSPHLTVRTSFIGIEAAPAKGLLGWFLEQSGLICGYRRCLWSGLTTAALARILLDLVSRRDVTGLLHIAGETIDKARLLKALAVALGKTDTLIHEVDEPICNRSLRSERRDVFDAKVPTIHEMLQELSLEFEETPCDRRRKDLDSRSHLEKDGPP